MRNFLVYCFSVLFLVVLTGCFLDPQQPEPDRTIDERLLGTWVKHDTSVVYEQHRFSRTNYRYIIRGAAVNNDTVEAGEWYADTSEGYFYYQITATGVETAVQYELRGTDELPQLWIIEPENQVRFDRE